MKEWTHNNCDQSNLESNLIKYHISVVGWYENFCTYHEDIYMISKCDHNHITYIVYSLLKLIGLETSKQL